MNGATGYFIFQFLPAVGALLYTFYLAYIVTNPARLKAKMSKYKEGTPRYEICCKLYNKQFLGAWVCITLFFVSGVAYDIYRSMYTPPFFVVFFELILTLSILFVGFSLMGRALKNR